MKVNLKSWYNQGMVFWGNVSCEGLIRCKYESCKGKGKVPKEECIRMFHGQFEQHFFAVLMYCAVLRCPVLRLHKKNILLLIELIGQ